MLDGVNGPVAGTARRDRARDTRRRIVTSAGELFMRNGYAATTLEEIARASGVAVQTVYFHFGNKRTVLKHVVDVAAVGDDDDVALLERPWTEELRSAADGPAVVAVWLRTSREIFARVAPVLSIVRDAATSDPDMAEQWRTNQEQRYVAHRSLADILQARGALRPGMSRDEAADTLFALISLEVYTLLTVERGWTSSRWEAWAQQVVSASVLRTGG